MGVSSYTEFAFSLRRVIRSRKLPSTIVARIDSAYLSSLNRTADTRTPEQHFLWFCLHPHNGDKSVLAGIVGWHRAADYYHRVMHPLLGRGKVGTASAASGNGKKIPVDSDTTTSCLSRRQRAKLAKNVTSGSDRTENGNLSGVHEHGRCLDPVEQIPCTVTQAETPDPDHVSADSARRRQKLAETDTDYRVIRRDETSTKGKGKRHRPVMVSTGTQSDTSSVPAKYAAVEATSTPPADDVPVVLDDEALCDIIRFSRRFHHPVERGAIVKRILLQCSVLPTPTSTPGVSRSVSPQNRTEPPPSQPVEKPSPPSSQGSGRGRSRLPKGRPAPMSAQELSRHPMYRHHGDPSHLRDIREDQNSYGYGW